MLASKREASALTFFFDLIIIIIIIIIYKRLCMNDQTGSSLCVKTQENFNLPVDPCDGGVGNL